MTAEETGLPGRPKKGSEGDAGGAGQFSEDRRLARLDADASEVKAGSDAGQGRLDEVEFARRDAAGDEQEIGSGGLGQRIVEGLSVVGGRG